MNNEHMENVVKITIGLLFLASVYFIYTAFIEEKNSSFANRPSSMPSAQNRLFNQILDEPLRNFYINTSHNSYLADNQVGGISSHGNTLSSLYSGARCIELDLRFPKDKVQQLANVPVVAHKGADHKMSVFEDHCIAIRDFAFALTNDPLIIYLEIDHADKQQYMQNIASLIRRYWGDRLYDYTFDKYYSKNSFSNDEFNRYLPNAPLRNLLGKICVVINFYNMNIGQEIGKNYRLGLKNRNEILAPVVHATTDEDKAGWFGRGNIMFGQPSSDPPIHSFFSFGRVYPANLLRSDNYNMAPFVQNGYSLIAFNLSYRDKFLPHYRQMFQVENIIPKFWYVNSNGNWDKAYNYNPGDNIQYVAYKNRQFFGAKNETQRIVQGCAYSNECKWIVNNWTLSMQNDGNLVMYKDGKPTWHTNTSGNPNAILVMQLDGNMVIYNQNRQAIWSSGTFGFGTTGVEMQVDGRLLMIARNKNQSNKTIKK